MPIIPVTDEAHWHKLRGKVVGSSEIACLFDASPYATRFTLWHEKAGLIDRTGRESDNRQTWGKRLEPAIAAGLAEDMSWKIERADKDFYQHDSLPIGATLDFRVVDHEWGPGVVEIKNVDWLEWKEKWTDIRAPDHIELQVQHQFIATGWSWGTIGCLVGGNDLKIYHRKPLSKIMAEIEQRTVDFWLSVEANQKPSPYGTAAEFNLLKELFPREVYRTVESEDPKLSEAASLYIYGQEQEAGGKRVRERYRVTLLNAMGEANRLIVPGYRIKRSVDKRGAVRLTVDPTEIGTMSKVEPAALDAG
jgi:predicted phage-related endonuclease